MNKAVILGAIIAIVIGIIIVSVVSSLEFSNNGSELEEVVVEETIPIEEVVLEETIPIEEEGRDLSVEFTESINLKSP
jgi:hypothetical protein